MRQCNVVRWPHGSLFQYRSLETVWTNTCQEKIGYDHKEKRSVVSNLVVWMMIYWCSLS